MFSHFSLFTTMSQDPTPSFRSAKSALDTLSQTTSTCNSSPDDETWTHGDFVLISQDRRRFRVDAHYLLSAR